MNSKLIVGSTSKLGSFDESKEPSNLPNLLEEDFDEHDESFMHSMWQNMEYMVLELPKLEDTVPEEREELIVKKLHLCTLVYNHRKKEEVRYSASEDQSDEL